MREGVGTLSPANDIIRVVYSRATPARAPWTDQSRLERANRKLSSNDEQRRETFKGQEKGMYSHQNLGSI
jgi:hypothetical protein